jgi:outer membrane protein assembly factor BamB
MYRCDMTRSAAAKTAVPDGLTVLWERKTVKPCASAGSSVAYDWPGNTPNDSVIAQPAVAGGRVFVSLTGSKQVLALEAKTGKVEWTFHLPARTDVPPTIHKGLALVGCHDGWVYAFRADSGERVWRTRAAPAERRMVAYGQLESTWPVVGGVLVVGDTAYALAGRTTEADGGLYLSALEPATGRVLWTRRRYLNNPGNIGVADSARYEELGTGASDVLGSDGKVVQFGRRETRKGGFKCDTGDDAGGYGAALRFGFDAVPVAVIGKELFIGQKKSGSDKKANIGRKGGWTLPVEAGSPVALAAAGERLIAGVSAGVEAGAKGELWVLSAADGKKLAAYPLPAAPACDGIAVANGRIYVSLTDGRVVCFGK